MDACWFQISVTHSLTYCIHWAVADAVIYTTWSIQLQRYSQLASSIVNKLKIMLSYDRLESELGGPKVHGAPNLLIDERRYKMSKIGWFGGEVIGSSTNR